MLFERKTAVGILLWRRSKEENSIDSVGIVILGAKRNRGYATHLWRSVKLLDLFFKESPGKIKVVISGDLAAQNFWKDVLEYESRFPKRKFKIQVIREGRGKELSLPSALRDSDILMSVAITVSSSIDKDEANKEFDGALAKLKEGNSAEQLNAFQDLLRVIREHRFLTTRVNVQKVINLISEENIGVMCYALQIIPIFFQQNELLVRKKKYLRKIFNKIKSKVIHPNPWIRVEAVDAAVSLIALDASKFAKVDISLKEKRGTGSFFFQ